MYEDDHLEAQYEDRFVVEDEDQYADALPEDMLETDCQQCPECGDCLTCPDSECPHEEES